MIKDKYTAVLKNLGLSERESEIYQYLLHKGSQSIKVIAKDLGTNMQKASQSIQELKEKKLVDVYTSKRIKYTRAEHPDALLTYARLRQEQLKDTEKRLESVIENLSTQYHISSAVPGYIRFEGVEGHNLAFDDILSDGLPVYGVYDRGSIYSTNDEHSYNDEYMKKRLEKGITQFCISREPLENIPKDASDEAGLRKIRYIPRDDFAWDMDMEINANKVLMATGNGEKRSGVVIKDADVASHFSRLYKFLFDMIEESK